MVGVGSVWTITELETRPRGVPVPQLYVTLQGNNEVISLLDINACRSGGIDRLILKLDAVGFAVIITVRPLNVIIQFDGFFGA